MAEPLTQRNFEEFDAARKPRRSVEAATASNQVLAELALRAVPRLRELAQELLRLEMTIAFAKYFDERVTDEWLPNAEFELWAAVTGKKIEDAERLQTLAVEAGGWWGREHGAEPPAFLTFDVWVVAYQDWTRKH